jgi:hypothetical protein
MLMPIIWGSAFKSWTLFLFRKSNKVEQFINFYNNETPVKSNISRTKSDMAWGRVGSTTCLCGMVWATLVILVLLPVVGRTVRSAMSYSVS